MKLDNNPCASVVTFTKDFQMRRKHEGYIFQFTAVDHGARHIHVFRDNRPVGVFDRVDGPIRGLEREWNRSLQVGLEKFIGELNERGHFLG